MNNNREHHITDSLHRWIEGDIDKEGEIRLEQEARKDPFLGEALEGFRQFTEGNHKERLDRLRERISTEKRKGFVLLSSLPFRIAAAAAVLLAVGLFWVLNPGNPGRLAQAETAEQAASAAEETAAGEAPPVVEENRSQESQPFSLEPGPRLTPAEQDGLADGAGRQRDDAALSQAVPQSYSRQKPAAEKKASAENDSSVARTREGYGKVPAPTILPSAPPPPTVIEPASASNEEARARRINGRITDAYGAPIANVNVLIPGENTGTVTNQNGQYEITLDPAVRRLVFQHNGYISRQLDLPETNDQLSLVMNETVATDQVVVTGKSESARKEKANPAVTGQAANTAVAQPVGGYRNFDRYLRRNLRYPKSAENQEVSGEVTLTFTILPDGRPINVRTVRGPGHGLNAEAIRLITEGPRWEITNGSTTSIAFTYVMKFSL